MRGWLYYHRPFQRNYGLTDNLSMTYTGNQIKTVTDAIADISLNTSIDFKNHGGTNSAHPYNKNGAMTSDSHKGILGIKYNSLNLPYGLLINNIEVSNKVFNRGLFYFKSVFYQKTQSDKIVNKTKGTVVNGIRITK